MARKTATTTHVERGDLMAFVRPRHRMIAITSRADGCPQASPVTGGVDAEDHPVALGPVATGGFPARVTP
ncbi:MAG: pyridoxamine 5-phosphate oxidase [Jatrophihabitantaceae bacterium]|nr:pyridoxamine 5-phosphate oxidase [Jatrophihabitantaceae bacterium]